MRRGKLIGAAVIAWLAAAAAFLLVIAVLAARRPAVADLPMLVLMVGVHSMLVAAPTLGVVWLSRHRPRVVRALVAVTTFLVLAVLTTAGLAVLMDTPPAHLLASLGDHEAWPWYAAVTVATGVFVKLSGSARRASWSRGWNF